MSDGAKAEQALCLLEQKGLIERSAGTYRTTRKWQVAMARAALRLYEKGDQGEDLRIPIASALVEIFGEKVGDEELADLVLAMLPIEAASLGRRG